MTVYKAIGAGDKRPITVNTLIKNPSVVPRRILDMTSQLFIADKLLRPGPPIPSGIVQFETSTPLFADGEPEVYEEFAEIPIVETSVGELKVAKAAWRGLSIRISERMRTRNNTDAVNRQMTQVRNTMVRSINGTFMSALRAAVPAGHVVPASNAWDGSDDDAPNILGDLAATIQTVTDEKAGFVIDTAVITPSIATAMMSVPSIWTAWQGNVAGSSPLVTGKLPNRLFGLDWYLTYDMDDEVQLLERKTVGFISDERALQATPLYEDRPRETWRSDVTRASAVGIDQPEASAVITGVLAS